MNINFNKIFFINLNENSSGASIEPKKNEFINKNDLLQQ